MADIQTVSEAVMLLDYAKSSGTTARFGNVASARRKGLLDRLVRAAAEQMTYRRDPKDTGDGYYITFESSQRAVDCAIAILQHLHLLNQNLEHPDLTIHLRVGITFGELTVDARGERKGEAANLCARYESMKPDDLREEQGGMTRAEFSASALVDRILVSGEVYEDIKDSHKPQLVGSIKPKDIRRTYEVFLVDWRHAAKRDLPGLNLNPPPPLAEKSPEPPPKPRCLKPNVRPTERKFEPLGLAWYEEKHADYFHGRRDDVLAIRRLLEDHAVVRLFGPSGVGKSSVLRAGVAPDLRDKLGWRVIVARPLDDPAKHLPGQFSAEILEPGSPSFSVPLNYARLRLELAPLLEADNSRFLVLLLDQVEDIVSPTAALDARETFTRFLQDLHRMLFQQPNIKALVTYRTDADTRLGAIWQTVSGQSAGLPYHVLNGVTRAAAAAALRDAEQSGLRFGMDAVKLADLLAAESRQAESAGEDEVYPPYLQIVIDQANRAHGHRLTEEQILKAGGVGGLIGRHLESLLEGLVQKGGDWRHCRRILESLSRSSGEKASQTFADLAADGGLSTEVLQTLLAEMCRLRLVRPLDSTRYEIQHDRLAAAVLAAMADSDREAKSAAELLAIKARNYPRTRQLLADEELHMLYLHRRQIKPRQNEIRLILRSLVVALVDREQSLGWFWSPSSTELALGAELRAMTIDVDRRIRIAAFDAVARLGTSTDLPFLYEWLLDDDWQIRRAAVKVVAKLGTSDDRPLLHKALSDVSRMVRIAALEALKRLGTTDDLPQMREMLRDADYSVPVVAAETLGELGTIEDLPIFRKRLTDESPYMRRAALMALGRLGTLAELPLVRNLLQDDDEDVRLAALSTLGKLGTLADLRLLQLALYDDSFQIVQAALEAVGQLLTVAEMPVLESWLQSNSVVKRQAAVVALSKRGTSADLPLLRERSKDDHSYVRQLAVEALSKRGTSADLPLLRERLKDELPYVRQVAVEAVGRLGTSADLPLLRERLQDDDSDVRGAAVEAVGRLGTAADLSLVRQRLQDDDSDVRGAAVEAMAQHLSHVELEQLLDEEANEMPFDVLSKLDELLYRPKWISERLAKNRD